MKVLRVLGLVVVSLVSWVNGIEGLERKRVGILSEPTYVGLTLISNAASKGAVCTDGSLPGYHLHRGWGSGANSWLVHLDGGGWCNDIPSCVYRKKTLRGSSNYMEKEVPFTGIVSDKPEKNPDFFNWNRVKVRYCDGGSFTGEGENKEEGLYFRGQRIWSVVIEELMSKGMNNADQALLSGCSAGGLAVIQHCDEFSSLFPGRTKVKCLSDAGMFLDAVDVAGERRMKSLFEGVVNLRGSGKTLPTRCTSRMDGVSCFFPQNVLPHIQTPTFILNSAYDAWQFKHGLATGAADPQGHWLGCKHNHSVCDAGQLRFLHGFRNQMLDAVQGFSMSKKNGLFINSCFSHCHSERQDTWLASDSPQLEKKAVATSVGNWYFDRSEEKLIDCKYPCDNTCRHMVSNFRDKQQLRQPQLRQPRLEISF